MDFYISEENLLGNYPCFKDGTHGKLFGCIFGKPNLTETSNNSQVTTLKENNRVVPLILRTLPKVKLPYIPRGTRLGQ
jgi:hypothetical protein